ncbi:hypothetical protein GCM10011505_11530 [Tistrella bauzanensis]|uniref:HTH lysR-type domain-containing protein n=1 Tax=Tistrella bauzanensis TaxID=657419 RepID=A0ABQ1IBN4_9PROT|nr:hypothetical protein GCM10011505_11530 [Tistrella bauzanensis]
MARPPLVPAQPPATRPTLSLRIDLSGGRRFGPGKAALLRHVAAEGSIAAAGREMGMSYARAWRLIEAMNGDFAERLVTRQTGGSGGGGAVLTEAGLKVLAAYDAALAAASAAAADAAAMIADLAGPAVEAPDTAVIPAPERDS